MDDFTSEDSVEQFEMRHLMGDDCAQFIDRPDLKARESDDEDLSLGLRSSAAAEVEDSAGGEHSDAHLIRPNAAHFLIEMVEKLEK
jgi:hypothetical protein